MPRTVDHGVSSRKDYNLLLLGSAMLVYLITTVRLFLLPLVSVLIVHDRASTSSNTCMQLILTIGTQFRYEETLHLSWNILTENSDGSARTLHVSCTYPSVHSIQ
jgi:hypothetical protein